MHEDCYFCIKRDICTKDVPKPCKYRYTEDERRADQASDMFGAILHKTYLHPTFRKKKEETKMNSTSTEEFKDIIAVDFELQTFPDPDVQDKFIVSATNRDDIFCFVFEGPYLADTCRKAGLFSNWEKDQKIRELENQNKKILDTNKQLQEKIFCLKAENNQLKSTTKEGDYVCLNSVPYSADDIKNLKNTINVLEEKNLDHQKAYNILNRALKKSQKNCNKWYKKWAELLHKYEHIKEEYEVLQRKYNLEREANEAQHKFFHQYAGEGTEIEFNYAIGDTDETTYVIVDKEEYQNLGNYVYLGSIPYSADDIKKLKEQIKKLEALKTPTIENFADEEPAADNVNHPSHYTGRYECIDVMQDVFGDEATDNFCLCNAFKYIWRARKKNGLEDVKKAVWYLNKYIEEAENGVRKGEQI